MPKFSNAQDWYAGRRKSQFCHQCGSQDGMQVVHRDALAEAMPAVLWHKKPGNAEVLFYTCPHCNHWRVVPNGYAHVSFDDIAAWFDRNPMAAACEGLPASVLAQAGAGRTEGMRV